MRSLRCSPLAENGFRDPPQRIADLLGTEPALILSGVVPTRIINPA
ncbi:hypothetical protein ACL02S_17540 [Nocardia sp. 004]